MEEDFLIPHLTCPKCNGRGIFERPVFEDLPAPRYKDFEDASMANEVATTYKIERLVCDRCFGERSIKAWVPTRPRLYQFGKWIGTFTGPKPEFRPSFFCQKRPGDFKVMLFDDQVAFEASPSLCPGDIETIRGFVRC